MNICGVIPKNVVNMNTSTVIVNDPVVPAYPGSEHNLFPMNTSNAAINPPWNPQAIIAIELINVPADASGEHNMFPWKNPPAKSPFLSCMSWPTMFAPCTPGISGNPKYVSTITKFRSDMIVANMIPIIMFILILPLFLVEVLEIHSKISILRIMPRLFL